MRGSRRVKYSLLIAVPLFMVLSYWLAGCVDAQATALSVSKAIAYQGTSDSLTDAFLDSERVFELEKEWRIRYRLELENLGYSSVRNSLANKEKLLGKWSVELERMDDTYQAFEGLVPPPGYSTHHRQVLDWMSAAIAKRQQMIVFVREYDRFTDMAGWIPGYTLEGKRQRGEEILHKLENPDELPLNNKYVGVVGEYRERQLEAARMFDELLPDERKLRASAEEERRLVFQ